jgi:hypothetical protein
VAHCRSNYQFPAGREVIKEVPSKDEGLADIEKVLKVPHIA